MAEKKALVKRPADSGVVLKDAEIRPLFERALVSVREELEDSPYIREALKVLPVGGYRSAIGSFWNAVIDDLRNKVLVRSIALFNKSVKLSREARTYEDLQDLVNDDQLIDGAYKIGVIGWEASKILRHAKETRHIFDGHPRSSEPSLVKVLAMFDDCIKYVLREPFPVQIIDIDEYLATLGESSFDRNAVGVENALCELPEVYKVELTNRLFTVYVDGNSSTVLRSNVEFVAPLLWKVLGKEVKQQVIRRVDQVFTKGNGDATEQAFSFVTAVDGGRYLSVSARKYRLSPLIKELKENLDTWKIENEMVRQLQPYAAVIPPDLLEDYVSALVQTYVGHVGSSARFNRSDFFADGAAGIIPDMVKFFDDRAADAFVECIRKGKRLKERITHPAKMRRLRSLGNIVLERVSDAYSNRRIIEALVDENKEELFWKLAGRP